MNSKIAVVGGGSFGTALAALAVENGCNTEIFVREQEIVESINKEHVNSVFLPNIPLPEALKAKTMEDLHSCDAEYFIWSVPSQFTRSVAKVYSEILKGKKVLLAAKGIEIATGNMMLTVLQEELDSEISILSGPSFAKEIIFKKPTLVSIGSSNKATAKWWQEALSCEYFRVYITTDIVGLEVGGSLKNILAISTGMSDGLDLGSDARAALISRGLVEMARYGVAFGAKPETFMGLAGVGDLVLTATCSQSRNYTVGRLLAEGKDIDEITGSMKMVAEGVPTAKAVYQVAKEKNIDMPICEEVYKIIYEKKDPKESLKDLMKRPLKEDVLDMDNL